MTPEEIVIILLCEAGIEGNAQENSNIVKCMVRALEEYSEEIVEALS